MTIRITKDLPRDYYGIKRDYEGSQEAPMQEAPHIQRLIPGSVLAHTFAVLRVFQGLLRIPRSCYELLGITWELLELPGITTKLVRIL